MLAVLPDYYFVARRLDKEFKDKRFLVLVFNFNRMKIFSFEQELGEKYVVDVTEKFAALFTEEDEEKYEDGYLVGDSIDGALAARCDFINRDRAYIIYL